MEGAMLGVMTVVASVLAAKRLGYDWRPATPRLKLAVGCFVFALVAPAIAVSSHESGWVVAGAIGGGLGAAALFLAVTQFSPRE